MIDAVPGDITGDGEVTSSDAFAAFSSPIADAGSEDYRILSDISASGDVNSSDAFLAFGHFGSDIEPLVASFGRFANFTSSSPTKGSEALVSQSNDRGPAVELTLAGAKDSRSQPRTSLKGQL